MIKMIAGVFGLPVTDENGRKHVQAMGVNSGPFSADPAQEKRLVDMKLAVYVKAHAAVDSGAPIGFDETPDEDVPTLLRGLDELNANELRELGKEYGLTFKVGTKKAEMVEAITAAQIAAAMGDEADNETPDEDAPTFDATEAVL